MVKGRVSICIPSRNERHLQRTIDSLLMHAHGDIEVIAVLDGDAWPNPPLRSDPRVIVVRHNEPRGMRPTINEAAQVASGEFYMKCDAHCMFADGYDEALKADCGDDWLVVPTRHSLDGEVWECEGEAAALRPRHYNYSILTYPFLRSMYGMGFHAVTLGQVQNKAVNAQREHLPVDDILGAQGSCWFQRLAYFQSFPPLDHERLYFYQESQENMLRILATGGRCVISKKTSYAHWHKGVTSQGADGRVGRGFFLNVHRKRHAEAIMAEWCMKGWPKEWPRAMRSFESIIEQHWWLISQVTDPKYAWPEDWRDWEKYRTWFEQRPPEEIPAHI